MNDSSDFFEWWNIAFSEARAVENDNSAVISDITLDSCQIALACNDGSLHDVPHDVDKNDATAMDTHVSYLPDLAGSNQENTASSNEAAQDFRIRRCQRTNQPRTLTRKRLTQKESWIDVAAKKARVFGIEGTGRKGVPILAKTLREGCNEHCRFKCRTHITDEERQTMFKYFWGLGDTAKQRQCIVHLVKTEELSPESDDEANANQKQVAHKYHLPDKNKQLVKVCKKMFLDTLDISYQWIRTSDKKMKAVNGTLVIGSDERGKHSNRPFKVPDTLKNVVREHISSFPVMDSHYCRENTTKKYLEEGLSLCKMYKLYKDDIDQRGENSFVSEQMYRRIFNSEFNYGFFIPKKDRCEQCEAFSNLAESDRDHDKHEKHLANKRRARQLMRDDKARAIENSSYCAINFDLQKVLSTPRAEIGPLYYMSKLCVWNFTIYDMANHEGLCNVWNETVGSRGANEIASFLWSYFNKKQLLGVREFALYSDNCGGQNRNKIVFSMFIKAANDLGIKITHRFLEVGHTQSDGDSMHARIEQHCRHKSVYTQQQWCTLMKEAKTTNPYSVNEVAQSEIYDFLEISKMFSWAPIKIASIREILVQPYVDTVRVKYDFDLEGREMKIFKKNKNMNDVHTFKLKQTSHIKLPLAPRKKNDLQAMLDRGFIPLKHHQDFSRILDDNDL